MDFPHLTIHKLRYSIRYLVDLKDVADRHLLYPEEHAQEEELQLEHLRQRIRAAKEETDLRDGLLQAKFTYLVIRAAGLGQPAAIYPLLFSSFWPTLACEYNQKIGSLVPISLPC